jgi:hypothetical protein
MGVFRLRFAFYPVSSFFVYIFTKVPVEMKVGVEKILYPVIKHIYKAIGMKSDNAQTSKPVSLSVSHFFGMGSIRAAVEMKV